MRRTERLFQIVQFLQQKRITKAEEIAEEMGVSVRTVYRDIQALSLSGVPIQGEAGVGYMLPRYFTLPPITFNHNELEALLLGIRIARSWADPQLGQAASSALRKIEAVLPENLQEQLDDTILFAPDFVVPEAMTRHLPILRAAIQKRQKISIGYTDWRGDASHRIVWPLALFFWGSAWSLTAWCELRNAFRNFRLDRFEKIEVLQEPFSPEPGQTLEDFHEHLEKSRTHSKWEKPSKNRSDEHEKES